MGINELKIKNLRCFADVKSSIRPITIIVGKNNTGKTTFLSVYKLIHDLLTETDQPISYLVEDLLKRKEYKYLGGPKNFKRDQANTDVVNIGAKLKVSTTDTWDVEYSIKNGKICEKIMIQCRENKIEINMREDNTMTFLVNKQRIHNITIPFQFGINFFRIISFLSTNPENVLTNNKRLDAQLATLEIFKEENLKNISCRLFEPIYSKPKSQYNPNDLETTDSSDILFKVAEMKQQAKMEHQKETWNKIHGEFKDFGNKSKLFQNLDIISHGDSKDSPFSIKVKAGGVETDITNVGYGVSQFFPILANILIANQNTNNNTFLIQQPEIHIHPQVEAEFATFMTNIVRKNSEKYKFICETHNDYIIQRARIEIQEGKLNPEHFSILYFELKDEETKIHQMTVDSNGNVENQPDSYQEFFLSEGYKLIGIEK